MERFGFLVAGLILAGVVACQEPDLCDIDGDGEGGTAGDEAVMASVLGLAEGDEGFLEAADFDGSGTITAVDWGRFLDECGGDQP